MQNFNSAPVAKLRSGFREKYFVFLVTSLLCKLAGSAFRLHSRLLRLCSAIENALRSYNP